MKGQDPMTNTHVVVLRSEPASAQANGALDLAQGLRDAGSIVTVALVQDAVLLALGNGDLPAQRGLRRLLEAGGRCVYLAQDLGLRGFGSTETVAGCTPADDGALVDLLLADGARVAGAF